MSAIEKWKAAELPALKVDTKAVMESIAANIGSGAVSEFDLPRLKVPAGGGTVWMVQTLEGEEPIQALLGVIIWKRDIRTYWQKGYDETAERNPPDCQSPDGIVGIGEPGGECAKCPLAQFGSDPKGGKGQACAQGEQLFLLTESSMLPTLLTLPPTSLKPARQYMMKLIGQGVPYYAALTAVTLKVVPNAAGIKYSQAEFQFVRMLSEQERGAAIAWQSMMTSIASKAPVFSPDQVVPDQAFTESDAAEPSWVAGSEKESGAPA